MDIAETILSPSAALRINPVEVLNTTRLTARSIADKKERCHYEIGAPDYRINGPFGLVLTPWDEDL